MIIKRKLYSGRKSSIKVNPEYIEKENQLWKEGYGVLPRQFEGRKKDFVYFTNGKDVVGYNIFTAEEHRPSTKNFSFIGYKIREAKATYRDALDFYNDPKNREEDKKRAEEYSKKIEKGPKAKFDDKTRTISYPSNSGRFKIQYKDDLRYNVAKEGQERSEKQAKRFAKKWIRDTKKSPKRRALGDTARRIRYFSETPQRKFKIDKNKLRQNFRKASNQNSIMSDNSIRDAVNANSIMTTGIPAM